MITPEVPLVPTSTYRLQFNSNFKFTDATSIIPYLTQLGIDTMYASPYFKARPGSTHGYDVIDHNAINPEIGTAQEHAAMIALAQKHGMAHLLDFVPNHMGIGETNVWWYDILTWGQRSPFAHYFDINWYPHTVETRGKVLLPVLGDLYGAVLERGELKLVYDEEKSRFVIQYFDKNFPVRMECYEAILQRVAESPAAADPASKSTLQSLIQEVHEYGHDRERSDGILRLLAKFFKEDASKKALNDALAMYVVSPETPEAADRLDDLVSQQHYRLAFWRLARDEINYRRFFDVNDLAGLCVEHVDVLCETHKLLFEWIQAGIVQGARIDHIDGLRDPASYCSILYHQYLSAGRKIYIVVEKILARYETLARDWEIAGTTGYEFSAFVAGISVDGTVEDRFSRIYQGFSGLERDFASVAREAKRLVMRTMLASELNVLTGMLEHIASSDRRSIDFTFSVLRDALSEVVACFPVYRTYVLNSEPSEKDVEYIEWAVKLAMKTHAREDQQVFEWIFDVLTTKINSSNGKYDRTDVLAFVQKFQQYTSPVMAKSVEDTTFYRYVRLLSLNEVGSDPARFGTSVNEFHKFAIDRAARYPTALSATATHDHKRGEDVRTRLNALTEMPEVWRRSLSAFSRVTNRWKPLVNGVPAPSANDEYAIYQTLLGTWPCEWLDGVPKEAEERETYAMRIENYLRKFVREAKLRSSWSMPDEAYEKATIDFARRLIDPTRSASFQRTFLPLANETARIGMLSSLVQLAVKSLAPGVPDCYQGCEFWDLTLVDPDNRGAVDFGMRQDLLNEMSKRLESESPGEIAKSLLGHWHDGQIKFFVLWRLLQIRRDNRDVMLSSSYKPLKASGRQASRVLAFMREDIVVVVPRLLRRLIGDGTTVAFAAGAVTIPKGARQYRDLLTNEIHDVEAGRLKLNGLFQTLPFAILQPVPETLEALA